MFGYLHSLLKKITVIFTQINEPWTYQIKLNCLLKPNKQYYKYIFRSLLIVVLGLAIIFFVSQGAGDIFLALLLYILCAFFGIILAPYILVVRTMKGIKYRRRFIYCLIGTINFCLGAISLSYAVRIKIHQIAAISISLLAFLVGSLVLVDIFFGKRDNRSQPEFLSI